MAKLRKKQEKFCHEYLIDLNATQAAIRAGYSKHTATNTGYEIMMKHDIREYIKELMEDRTKRTEITGDMVIKELAKIAFITESDFYEEDGTVKQLSELTNDQRAGLASYYVKTIKDGEDTIDVPIFKTHDKRQALDSLGKHFGIFEKDNNQQKPDPVTHIIKVYR